MKPATQKLGLSVVLVAVLAVRGIQCVVKRSDDVPALEAVVSGLSQQVTQLQAQLTALTSQHDQLKARFDSSRTSVSFLAYHRADPFNVPTRDTIHYDTADVNQGNGLDTHSGIFTAPVPGVYVFFLNCMCDADEEDARILVDGHAMAGCYSYSDGNHDQGAGMAVVHLTAGQKAWVKMFRDNRDVRGGIWHTFVGFLLHADD